MIGLKLPERDFYITPIGKTIKTVEWHLFRGHCCQKGCLHCPYILNSQNFIEFNQRKQEQIQTSSVISLIPSMTETLIHADVQVVGRTRFCIHPDEIVKRIPIVGGTKHFSVSPNQLNADFILFDKEENTLEMSRQCANSNQIILHIENLITFHNQLMNLADILRAPKLEVFAKRLASILEFPPFKFQLWEDLPGLIEWWKKPQGSITDYETVYVIWQNPWMSISEKTFIGSILKKIGMPKLYEFKTKSVTKNLKKSYERYPIFNIQDLPEKSLLLFSSEPYPFQKFKNNYLTSHYPYPAALVDGTVFSWFGIRVIRFLEDLYSTIRR